MTGTGRQRTRSVDAEYGSLHIIPAAAATRLISPYPGPGSHAHGQCERQWADNHSRLVQSAIRFTLQDEEALRLPKGRAAERLAAPASKPRGLWFERRGRDIAGDIEVLSREWTRLWVISVAVSLCILAADSQAETPC